MPAKLGPPVEQVAYAAHQGRAPQGNGPRGAFSGLQLPAAGLPRAAHGVGRT
jgi:hypothetical protein